MGDFPHAITALKLIDISRPYHLHHIVLVGTHAVDVTDPAGMIGIVKGDAQVSCQMMRLTPHRIEDVINRFAYPLVTMKTTEHLANVPDRIEVPNTDKTIPISKADNVTIIR